MEEVKATSKQPYTKPTLTKHKPLRDITAQSASLPGGTFT
jgi:hypothetical protein